jgi:tetratricopeptide (TPR) repeat protein
VALDPNESSAWLNKGLALYQLEKYKKSIEMFDKVLQLEPNNITARDQKGLASDKFKKRLENKNLNSRRSGSPLEVNREYYLGSASDEMKTIDKVMVYGVVCAAVVVSLVVGLRIFSIILR